MTPTEREEYGRQITPAVARAKKRRETVTHVKWHDGRVEVQTTPTRLITSPDTAPVASRRGAVQETLL